VDAHDSDPSDLIEQLNPVARVVLDAPELPVVNAFGVRSFPRFCVLGPDATLSAVASTVSRLPAGAPA
jgi:hypothetical protein